MNESSQMPGDGRREPPSGAIDHRIGRLVELLPVGAAYLEGERLLINPAVEALTGYAQHELDTVGAWFRTLFGDDAAQMRAIYESDRAAGFPAPRIVTLRRRDGELRHFKFMGRATGEAVVWTLHDVTERERAALALTESEARFRSLVEATAQMVWRTAPDGRPFANADSFLDFTGLPQPADPADAQHSWFEAVPPSERGRIREAWARACEKREPFDMVHRLRRRDGEWRTVHTRAVPVRDADGSIREWVGSLSDITERARAERAIRLLADASTLLEAELDPGELIQRLAGIIRGRLGDACLIELVSDRGEPSRRIVASSLEGELRERSTAYLDSLPPLREGSLMSRVLASRESLLVPRLTEEMVAATGQSPEQVAAFRQLDVESVLVVPIVAHGIAHGVITFVSLGAGNRLTDDDLRLAEALASRVALAVSSARAFAAAQAEVQERRRVEAALRESQARMEEAQRLGRLGSWSWDVTCDESVLSPEFYHIAGLEPGDEAVGLRDYASLVHPDDRAAFEAVSMHALARQLPFAEGEYRIVRPDGGVRRIQVRAEYRYDESGAPLSGFGTVQDVTEQRQLEEQLLHAQKMEAVGRLAGGVAHDFNNLLTVIGGAAQFLLESCPPDDPRHEDVLDISRAAGRAAELTRQLLTFSRRQVLRPRRVDLDALVGDTERMLQRMAGPDVELETRLAGALPPVYVDPGQLEQVLANLVVNARDAMPEGGRLTIATTRSTVVAGARPALGLAPGEYVVLTVHDTGIGMDEATRSRAFDPFFTTKGPEQGTGLGLPTVFGIVKQAGGDVAVESEPGGGSTFRVYLPVAPPLDAPPPAADDRSAAPARAAEGSETLLVVEDETRVRHLVCRTLEAHGYTVLQAGSGTEAIAVADAHSGPIHLVVTDVMLPELSGPEAVTVLAGKRPGLRALFMSGHTPDVQLHRQVSASDVRFLQKPFAMTALAAAVREVLDAPSR